MSNAFELSNLARGRALFAELRRRFRTAAGEHARVRETCFDTFDWRLWGAGAVLRGHREGREWLMRWSSSDRDDEHLPRFKKPPAFDAALSDARPGDMLAPLGIGAHTANDGRDWDYVR